MRAALGTFARSAIEARLGPDIEAGVREALAHYARRQNESGWAPMELPRFRREDPLETSGADLELSLEPQIRRSLEREVRRHRASIEQLAAHAVLVFLADLDSQQPTRRFPGSG